ncbi:hypothetical protein [Aliarcobacter butzleri]|uniref:hypothetical protein n=1 Tax=Aliarcobacter butzleri TaxID=28197 RepID=UPI001260B161|nr:hypothetical protein [Aliarcobacter butzleri]
MKNKLLIVCLASCLTTSIFAKELILTGEQALKNTNQFKEALNIPKKGDINTIVLKDISLPVKTNLEENIYSNHVHAKTYELSKESIKNIVNVYAGENYNISPKGKDYQFTIESGVVNIDYMVEENTQIQNHVTKIEVTLTMLLVKNGTEYRVTRTMDQNLGVTGDNYDWTITTTKDFSFKATETNVQHIVETLIYKFLNEKGL